MSSERVKDATSGWSDQGSHDDDDDASSSSSSSASVSTDDDDDDARFSQQEKGSRGSSDKLSNFRRRGHLKGPFHKLGEAGIESDDLHDGKTKGATRSWKRFVHRTTVSLHRVVSRKCPVLLNQKCNVILFIALVFWLVMALSSSPENSSRRHRIPPNVKVRPPSVRVPNEAASRKRIPEKPNLLQSAVNGLSDILASAQTPPKKKNKEADEEGCVRPPWHSYSFQTCNEIHGIDLKDMILRGNGKDNNPHGFGFVAAGLWRSVYVVSARDAQEVSVLKVMKGEHSVDARNIDRHRRDALVMERLTGSPNVVDIYGFCGNTVLTEFAPKPLDDLIYARPGVNVESSIDGVTRRTEEGRLKLAIGTMKGLAAIHEVEGGPIVHADIQARQFLITDSGDIKINDFNRCRIMAHRHDTGVPCKFSIPTSPGKARSPEEYKDASLDEKLDVYSTAHVLYGILTGRKAWYEYSTSETKNYVKQGAIPDIPDECRRPGTTDAVLANLTELAYAVDPSKRLSARQIVIELERARELYRLGQ